MRARGRGALTDLHVLGLAHLHAQLVGYALEVGVPLAQAGEGVVQSGLQLAAALVLLLQLVLQVVILVLQQQDLEPQLADLLVAVDRLDDALAALEFQLAFGGAEGLVQLRAVSISGRGLQNRALTSLASLSACASMFEAMRRQGVDGGCGKDGGCVRSLRARGTSKHNMAHPGSTHGPPDRAIPGSFEAT